MTEEKVEICIAGVAADGLAAFGAVLRFGQHHREFGACFPGVIYPEKTVLMEGVIAALKKVSRACNITVVACNGYELHSDLQNTPFPHLRGELERLEEMHHAIRWESRPEHEDIVLCRDLATKSIVAYKDALESIRPGLDFIRQTMAVFDVGAEARLSVERWGKKSEEGLDEWTDPVGVSVLRE